VSAAGFGWTGNFTGNSASASAQACSSTYQRPRRAVAHQIACHHTPDSYGHPAASACLYFTTAGVIVQTQPSVLSFWMNDLWSFEISISKPGADGIASIIGCGS
jgi:hypothetical protein